MYIGLTGGRCSLDLSSLPRGRCSLDASLGSASFLRLFTPLHLQRLPLLKGGRPPGWTGRPPGAASGWAGRVRRPPPELGDPLAWLGGRATWPVLSGAEAFDKHPTIADSTRNHLCYFSLVVRF